MIVDCTAGHQGVQFDVWVHQAPCSWSLCHRNCCSVFCFRTHHHKYMSGHVAEHLRKCAHQFLSLVKNFLTDAFLYTDCVAQLFILLAEAIPVPERRCKLEPDTASLVSTWLSLLLELSSKATVAKVCCEGLGDDKETRVGGVGVDSMNMVKI